MKRIFIFCSVLLISMTVAFSSSSRTAPAELFSALKEIHPDIYNTNGEEVFQAKISALERDAASLDDFSYTMRLSEIAALVCDSHTHVALGSAIDQNGKLLPLVLKRVGSGIFAGGIEKKHSAYLGKEVSSINDTPIEEVFKRVEPYQSHDNDVWLIRQTISALTFKQMLDFLSVSSIEDESAVIGFSDGSSVTLPYVNFNDDVDIVKLGKSFSGVTKADRKRNYFYKVDGPIVYLQYNSCRRDENYSFETMVKEIEKENFDALVVDLRNNTGGSDGVIWPLFEYLEENPDIKLYCLIGENTYSSAIINACQLDFLYGALLVGSETGGSVNHYGQTKSGRLDGGTRVSISTKWIDLDASLGSSYGEGALKPDVRIEQSIEDYAEGRDIAYEFIKFHRIFN